MKKNTTTQSPWRKNFFVKAALLLVIVYCIDFTLGKLLSHFYFTQQSGLLYRTTYSMEKTQAGFLVFGSSRANHHYNPEVLEKKLNMSYYNAGRDGNFIFYHYAVLKSVLKRYRPKIVVLDFLTGEFGPNKDAYDRLSSLLPYYKTHPEIRPIVNLKSEFEQYKLVSNIYPYNSLLFTIFAGNAAFNKERAGDIQGYVPLKNIWNEPAKNMDFETHYTIDSIKVNTFESFIHDCKEAGVKLYVVCSPILQHSAVEDYSVSIAKDIASKNGVQFFDYSRDTSYSNHSNLFSDVFHLNDDGAKIFSAHLADTIHIKN
ncbi:MAG: hypothetical protein JST86_02635 [Bacteroidetes bacterium]|nr:hypothetical protein [Bacteroidota bacterium]